MGIFAMISTRDLYSPAIVLPGERFRRPDEGPADTLPLMLGSDRQGSQTGEIPGCVEQRSSARLRHLRSRWWIVGNQHGIRRAAHQRR